MAYSVEFGFWALCVCIGRSRSPPTCAPINSMIFQKQLHADTSHVRKELISEIFSAMRGSTNAVMLFGSVARGESDQDSDVDVLQVVDKAFPPYKTRNLSFSVYSFASLSKMATEGSLFIRHLIEEGVVLRDDERRLSRSLGRYIEPENYEKYLKDLTAAAGFLDVSADFYKKKWTGLNSLALHILRSALYVQCAEAGQPLFSMRSVAERYEDSRIERAYTMKLDKSPDWAGFNRTKHLIETYLHCKVKNPFGSIEDLIIANQASPVVVALGLRLLKDEADLGLYETVKAASGADKWIE